MNFDMESNVARVVKWTKEALEFWGNQGQCSVILSAVISVGSVSQTGYGFEDLVNSINSKDIKDKVKKLVITDTTYLYRYCVPKFSVYQDQKLQTPWQTNNKETLSKLEVSTELKSWVNEINTQLFNQWYKQILQDYTYDKNYNGFVDENASTSASKGNGSFEQCRDFILEEGAHLCALLKNAVIVYPMPFYSSMRYLIEKYKLNITHLAYKLSNFSRKRN